MAERRMFAKTIVLSDAFLDMPLSARCLYFTLGMVADDDGFVNAPRSIMRQCGASDDDMKLLISKKFVLLFDNGVIVIKHWRINNYLRSDRYIATKYKEQKDELELDENGSYRIAEKEEIPELDEGEQEEKLSGKDLRKKAYEESDLPYSFEYKIKNYFSGKPCPICGFDMKNIENGVHRPTIQHNIPISKGGKHDLSNISVICHSCNVSIQDKETGDLNNAEVVKAWNEISGIPGIPNNGIPSIGKDSIGKGSLEEESIGQDNNTLNTSTLQVGEIRDCKGEEQSSLPADLAEAEKKLEEIREKAKQLSESNKSSLEDRKLYYLKHIAWYREHNITTDYLYQQAAAEGIQL